MRHGLDLPFRQAAGHCIASSLNPQSQSAVTKSDISFHLFSTLWDDPSDFWWSVLQSVGEAKNGCRESESTIK